MNATSRSFSHVQLVASDVWTINHNLGFLPVVSTVVTEAGATQEILPLSVEFPSALQVIIRFTTPRTGSARVV